MDVDKIDRLSLVSAQMVEIFANFLSSRWSNFSVAGFDYDSDHGCKFPIVQLVPALVPCPPLDEVIKILRYWRRSLISMELLQVEVAPLPHPTGSDVRADVRACGFWSGWNPAV